MITSLKKAIPSDVCARIVDYFIITTLSAAFTIGCFVLVCIKLNNAFVEIRTILN